MPDKAYGEEKDTGKAYGRHIILETIKHKAELPHWVDVLIVRVIGLVHGLLFLGGMFVSGMGIARSRRSAAGPHVVRRAAPFALHGSAHCRVAAGRQRDNKGATKGESINEPRPHTPSQQLLALVAQSRVV